MKFIIPILSFIITGYILFRSINKWFSSPQNKKLIIKKLILNWVFTVGIIFIYPYILKFTKISEIYTIQTLSIQSIVFYTIYCWFGWFIILLSSRIKSNITIFLTTLFSFFSIAIFGIYLWIQSILLFIIISALGEEFLKITSSRKINSILQYNSDNIFYAMIVWLTFSLIENITFFLTKNNLLWEIAISTVSRWLTSSIIHIISTWLIAYFIITFQKRFHLIPSTIFSFIIWVSIHTAFNFGLQDKIWLSILIIVFWYFIISFLIYQTNLIYSPHSK